MTPHVSTSTTDDLRLKAQSPKAWIKLVFCIKGAVGLKEQWMRHAGWKTPVSGRSCFTKACSICPRQLSMYCTTLAGQLAT